MTAPFREKRTNVRYEIDSCISSVRRRIRHNLSSQRRPYCSENSRMGLIEFKTATLTCIDANMRVVSGSAGLISQVNLYAFAELHLAAARRSQECKAQGAVRPETIAG